jgi:hypothetical protein
MNKISAILLIAFGGACILYGAYANFSAEQIITLAPPRDSGSSTREIPLRPVAGGLALWGGIILLVTKSK